MSDSLSSQVQDGVDAIRDAAGSAADRLRGVKHLVGDTGSNALVRGRQAASALDDFVHESPWQAMALSLVIGLAVGKVWSEISK